MRARTRLALDLALALALVAAFRPTWTGIPIHQWLSIAIIAPLLVHVIVNWEWTLRVIRTFVDRLLHMSRLNLGVDSLLFVSAVSVMVSGFMVSPVLLGPLGVHPAQPMLWREVHLVSANATIALLALHGALHWRWLVGAFRRLALDVADRVRGVRSGSPSYTAVAASNNGGAETPVRRHSRIGSRARQAAAERATVVRTLSVLGVTAVAAATVFAAATLASPLLAPKASGSRTVSAANMTCPKTGCTASRCHADYGLSAAAFYRPAKAKSKSSAKAVRRRAHKAASHAVVRVASVKTSSRPRVAVTSKATRAASVSVARKTAKVAAVAPARRVAKVMRCPSTGCTASSCHGSHGVSAARWYKNH